MKIGGKLQRVPNEGGQGRKIVQTLVLVVVDLDAAKLLFFWEEGKVFLCLRYQ